MVNAASLKRPTTGFRWTPSWVAWALGSFGFLIATIFIGRIYYVHWYRSDEAILREDVLRVSDNLQTDLEKMMDDAESWRKNMPLDQGFSRWSYSPPVEGVLSFRIYDNGQARAEWRAAGFREEFSGLIPIMVAARETRFARLGPKQLILSWVSKDGLVSVLIFDPEKLNSRFVNDPYRADKTSVALLNSMDQMIFETESSLNHEQFRGKLQYNYESGTELQVREFGNDIIAFYSVPNIKGLVVIGRTSRKL